MKKIGEYWKVQEGSKVIWKVQFPNGIMSFNTKKVALKWVEQLQKEN